MLKRNLSIVLLLSVFCLAQNKTFSQPTWTLDPFGKEKKPEKFEERKLGSEKTADKKFTKPRHLIQNTITHYNYYFNANNKVNAVIEAAKTSQRDDYTKLLPYYPYSLENTASQKQELDSVIYKCTAGILLHDLRNDWIDNLYLLIGKAYFFRKDFDSAANTFQFINYNLFPRKKKDDDDKIVGTTGSSASNNISIANKEKRNILQKVASLPPSRNDALIWLSRSLTEQDELGEAAGLINTLMYDANLPKRLRNDLEEVYAYWFYKQGIYDSAAVHLEKAITNANTKEDKAREEFLLAQLYEISNQYNKASDYYARASKHTIDPVMDIFARLNDAKMMRSTNNIKELENNIGNLARLAKKDKFDTYRDIIYFSAGQLTMQKPDTANAIDYFKKSLKYNESNVSYKNKAFLQLADIAYSRKQYKLAFAYYDSLVTGDTTLGVSLAQIQARREGLLKIVTSLNIIEREDSLQRIAAMQPAERDAFVKKILKKLRKEQGLKEEDNSGGFTPITFSNNNEPVDLFSSSTKGEWYFYNNSLKSRGLNEFKTKWGSRTNTDNWRRKSATGAGSINPGLDVDGKAKDNNSKDDKDSKNKDSKRDALNNALSDELSYDGLTKNLPLTPEKIGNSNDLISGNLLLLAKAYQEDLEDFEMAAAAYEEYLRRYPDKLIDGEVYLGLYYCYTKLGNKSKADYYKNLLNTKFKDTKFGKMANSPASLNPKTQNPEATKKYESIYNLFIEGKFEEALAQKKAADSLYGNNFWSPQLLYIEAVYYVKQTNDSAALKVLKDIIALYPSSPLKPKAENLRDVLLRRKEIEGYLTNLQVTRMQDEKPVVVNNIPAVVNRPVVKPVPVISDSLKKTLAPPLTNNGFTLNPTAPHFVIMVLDKVDAVYINESKNAFARFNRNYFSSRTIQINKEPVDADKTLLVFSTFTSAEDALIYYDRIKRAATAEISWLSAAKYSFLIITDENLQLLKQNKNFTDYKKLLNTQYPYRF